MVVKKHLLLIDPTKIIIILAYLVQAIKKNILFQPIIAQILQVALINVRDRKIGLVFVRLFLKKLSFVKGMHTLIVKFPPISHCNKALKYKLL
jgi:hypothetical protein